MKISEWRMSMKIKIIRLILFIALSGLLMFMGNYPNTWEFWVVMACAGGISITEYADRKESGNDGRA